MDYITKLIEKLMKSTIFNVIMITLILIYAVSKIYNKNSSLNKEKQGQYEENIKLIYDNSLKKSIEYIINKDYIIKKGDNILNILINDLKIDEESYSQIISAIKKLRNPNKLIVGDVIKVKFLQVGNKNIVEELIMDPYKNSGISVKKNNKGYYEAKKIKEFLSKNIVKYSGQIKKGDNGIFDSMMRIGIPVEIINNFITMYSFDIDFGRDIQLGTKFEILFERYYNQNNVPIEIGGILYAAIQLGKNGRSYKFYNYKIKNQNEYFDIKGNSIRKSLLKTPINGARISSRFGMRRHPILGYNKMHKGLDFAARTGTPIFAAGSGVVKESRWKGAYGKYVRIKHNSEYQTAYAHLSKIKPKIKPGRRVKQGEVIGYVGSTGRSTGSHLHYEILKRGKQINPAKVKSTPGKKLTKSQLIKFRKNSVEKINTIRSKVPNLNESI
jgi:murein DD-endopeptidase MepM/ murein hydrolase activator NlpD